MSKENVNQTISKEEFLYFVSRERTLEQVAEEFDLTELTVLGIVNNYKNSGIPIVTSKKDDFISIFYKGDIDNVFGNTYKLDIGESRNFKFAAISDTRLGSKYQQLTILNNIYEKAYEEGIRTVFHCGDISEGLYNIKTKTTYYDSLFKHDSALQAYYIISHYPEIEGMKTYFVTGDQDRTHISKRGIDIGKKISGARDDMIYLGAVSCTVRLKNINILVQHPKGKVPYTISYRPQKNMVNIRSEDKPDILLHGHWLQCQALQYRNIHEFSVPSLVATTPRMIDESIHNTTGAWFIDISFDEKGQLSENVKARIIPLYNTDKHDYKRAKVLTIGGRK